MIFNSIKTPLLMAVTAIVSATLATATPITTAGLTVVSGPLTFSNFTCAFTGSGMNTGACSTIDASALTPPPAGIQFSTNLAVQGASSADVALAFNVTSATGINQVGLTFNSSFFGLEVNTVTENIYNGSLAGGIITTLTAHCSAVTGCVASTTDFMSLPNMYTNLYITKDINLAGFATNDLGSVSIIDQTFTGTVTPEPVSVSLIGGGLAIFGLSRVRKNRKSVA